MKLLSKNALRTAFRYVEQYGRNLEKSILDKYLYNGDEKKVINELKRFQNTDGGFGYGLEPDFHLPHSSPMATTVAFQILHKLKIENEAIEIIKQGISYFERTYNDERRGWYSVSEEVNHYPHASWWNFNEGERMTIVDENWGNPTAEIVSYLYRYKDHVNSLDVNKLLDQSINYFLSKTKFTSQYEVYCFIKLYYTLPNNLKKKIKGKLTDAVGQILCKDVDKWDEFIAYPLRIIKNPKDEKFLINEGLLEKNLEYLIDYIEKYGRIEPRWKWDDCADDNRVTNWKLDDHLEGWEKAKNAWMGVLTSEVLMSLCDFKRIEI